MEVVVGPISRVVGHITLNVKVEGAEVKSELRVANDSRFIEALIVGRRADEAPEIASRICGPCSISHTLASITAVENAMGVEPSEDVKLLRELLCYAVHLQNQPVHLYFLTLPDYLGCRSLPELAEKQPEIVKTGLRLKTYGNRFAEAIGGRVVHPNACVLGGFTKQPSCERIQATINMLQEARKYVLEAVDLFLSLTLPGMESGSDLHLAVSGGSGYPLMGETLATSNGLSFPSSEYGKFIEEQAYPYSTSKYSVMKGFSFYVGSRARMNLHHGGLSDDAREYAGKLGLPLRNPFGNIPAKAVELLHCVDRSIELLDSLKGRGLDAKSEVRFSAGEGVGTVEAPRGTLIHHYKVDESGTVKYANIVTPTAMNGRHIEESSEDLVRRSLEDRRDDEELKFDLGRLIRAYDPCLGCATHLIEVNLQKA
ncbi:MAG: Ni/Fe hydrogenase subunit alpha [Candidatus Bathyarchaeia archaeon]